MSSGLFGFSSNSRQTAEAYKKVVEDHLQHDLSEGDRAAIIKGSTRLAYSAITASTAFAALGIYAAVRRRSALRSALAHLPRDVHITATNAEGQTVALDAPRLTIDPSRERLGFFFNALVLGTLGLLVGGEIGVVAGGAWAQRTIAKEGDYRRITRALKRTQVDLLRAQADALEHSVDEPIGGGV